MVKEKDVLWCVSPGNDSHISKVNDDDDYREQCKVCRRWFDKDKVNRGVCLECEKG